MSKPGRLPARFGKRIARSPPVPTIKIRKPAKTKPPEPENKQRVYKCNAELERFLVPLDSLKLDENNAREHPAKNLRAIKESLDKFGSQKPVVNDTDKIVRVGNGQVMAARELKWTHIPAITTQLKGADLIAYAIADNRTGELSQWNQDILAKLVAEFETGGVDSPIPGYNMGELEELVSHHDNAEQRAKTRDALADLLADQIGDLKHGTMLEFGKSVVVVACPVNDLSLWRKLIKDDTEFVVPYPGLLAVLGNKFAGKKCLFIQPHGGAAAFLLAYMKKTGVKVKVIDP